MTLSAAMVSHTNKPGLPVPELLNAPAPAEDAEALSRLDLRSSASPWSARQFREEIEKPWARAWVWRGLEGIAAFGIYWQVAGEAQLANLAVHPDCRRQGLGGRVLRWLLSEAAAAKAGKMTLEVREGNAAARRLYASAGFFETSRRPRYYENHEAAILMEKSLEAL